MPDGDFWGVGDLPDRGPDTKGVIEWFMKNGNSVMGNHEHMMIDVYRCTRFYPLLTWTWNGGLNTMESYIEPKNDDHRKMVDEIDYITHGAYGSKSEEDAHFSLVKLMHEVVPLEHIEWLETRPLYHEEDGVIITHAPILPLVPFDQLLELGDSYNDPRCNRSVIWNRQKTTRRTDLIQVHGHNAYYNSQTFNDVDGVHTINVDSSRGNKLTGVNMPSQQMFEEDY